MNNSPFITAKSELDNLTYAVEQGIVTVPTALAKAFVLGMQTAADSITNSVKDLSQQPIMHARKPGAGVWCGDESYAPGNTIHLDKVTCKECLNALTSNE